MQPANAPLGILRAQSRLLYQRIFPGYRRSVMGAKVLPSRSRFSGLTLGQSPVLLILGLLFFLILFAVMRPALSRSEDPDQVLAQADRLAWLSNWQKAAELYARGKQLAIQKNNKRDEFYAECGSLRS